MRPQGACVWVDGSLLPLQPRHVLLPLPLVAAAAMVLPQLSLRVAVASQSSSSPAPFPSFRLHRLAFVVVGRRRSSWFVVARCPFVAAVVIRRRHRHR